MARREYAWDGQGQAYVLTDERRWLWQGQLRIAAELDETGGITKRFVYGTKVNVPEYMVTYDPVSHLETGTYRILTDQLGSPRLVVDVSAGTVVQRMRHDEWGNVLENVGSGITPFGFAKGLYDPATGLVRFGARDYDPETGRWTGKDPLIHGSGSANLLTYCSEDPINLFDLSGQAPQVMRRGYAFLCNGDLVYEPLECTYARGERGLPAMPWDDPSVPPSNQGPPVEPVECSVEKDAPGERKLPSWLPDLLGKLPRTLFPIDGLWMRRQVLDAKSKREIPVNY